MIHTELTIPPPPTPANSLNLESAVLSSYEVASPTQRPSSDEPSNGLQIQTIVNFCLLIVKTVLPVQLRRAGNLERI